MHVNAYRLLWRAIFWIAFVLWVVPELLASKLSRSTKSTNAQDKGSLNVIATLWFIGIALDFCLAIYAPLASVSWNRRLVFATGVFLMLAGTGFRWYSAKLLGKYFTFDVATHKDQQLVTAGPYRYIRHPSYSGALLSLLGFGLALGNWASALAGTCCLALAYAYRIPVEEAALSVALGEGYKQYARRTWRLVPFVY